MDADKLAELTAPIKVSVGADIPPGGSVRLLVHSMGSHVEYRFRSGLEVYEVSHPISGFGFALEMDGPGFGTPFLEHITFESTTRIEYDAEWLFRSESGLTLVRPNQGRPYLAWPILGSELVFSSEITRPWQIRANGHMPGDSMIRLKLLGTTRSGEDWHLNLVGLQPVAQAPIDLASLACEIKLKASSDSSYTPSLEGVTFEGDLRRIEVPVKRFVPEVVPTGLHFVDVEGFSALMLSPILPQFSEPPTVIERIFQMGARGELKPEPLQ